MDWKEGEDYSSGKMSLQYFAKSLDEKSREDLIDECIELYKEKQRLERELKKFKNPHTPSSKQGFDKPQAQGLPVGRKLGSKSAHEGKTRESDIPTRTVEVKATVNPSNGGTNIIRTGECEERIITDFKITKTVIRYRVYYYRDVDNGEVFLASHPDLPDKGIFGKNVMSLANLLHFEHRVTLKGVADFFTNVADIPMTPPTVMELCNRAVEKATPAYKSIHAKLQESPAINADETGSNQNGRPEWMWGFFTPLLAFFVLYQQRGGDIVQNVLKNFKGILGCDGWATYQVFSEKQGILLQRCWAHLIREVKSTCKDVKELHDAYVWICDMFEEIGKLRKIKSRKIRQRGYEKLVAEMDMWCQMYYAHDGMKELVNKVKNGKEFWFTCVLHLEIEPTNNRAERGLRKFVVIEKIIGCLRSEQGKRNMQVMLSVFQTWRLQGLNPYNELRAIV